MRSNGRCESIIASSRRWRSEKMNRNIGLSRSVRSMTASVEWKGKDEHEGQGTEQYQVREHMYRRTYSWPSPQHCTCCPLPLMQTLPPLLSLLPLLLLPPLLQSLQPTTQRHCHCPSPHQVPLLPLQSATLHLQPPLVALL